MKAVLLVGLVMSLSCCVEYEDAPADMRCHRDTVEVLDDLGQWVLETDCTKYCVEHSGTT